MPLSDEHLRYVAEHPSAAMITIGRDGLPKPARVGLGVVDGRIWSSGTADRVRTKRLRRDPRCTLFVFDPAFTWLGLETQVRILDGPDAPELNLRLFRHVQGRPQGALSWFGAELDEPAFLEQMRTERRLVYESDVERA